VRKWEVIGASALSEDSAIDTRSHTFILIPGRTSRQGVGISEGKFGAAYQDETGTVQMCPQDMERLGLSEGARVRLSNECGEVEVSVAAAKGDELPAGMLFMAFGPPSSRLMEGDTHGSGMPTSKGIDVQLQVI
jgi:formylmethanofuran dehydrogenase subunit D